MKIKHPAALAALVLTAALGCQQSSPTTPAQQKETDVRIRTPGADVDIKGKGDGKGSDVDVDVNRKERNR